MRKNAKKRLFVERQTNLPAGLRKGVPIMKELVLFVMLREVIDSFLRKNYISSALADELRNFARQIFEQAAESGLFEKEKFLTTLAAYIDARGKGRGVGGDSNIDFGGFWVAKHLLKAAGLEK
jgi:hypothetical protein